MSNSTHTDATLTRRQAREIERRTGIRPIAGASFAKPAPIERPAIDAMHDTGRIERNAVTSLMSVVPTEVIERVAAPAKAIAFGSPAEAATGRMTVRAARPASLVARSRRRTATGFAVAASAAALATAGMVVPAQASDTQAAHQANLLSSDTVLEETPSAAPVETPAETSTETVEQTDLVAAPETAASRGSYSVTSFSPDSVAETVAPAPAPSTSTQGGVSTGGTTSGAVSSVVTNSMVAPINGGRLTDVFGWRAWTGSQHNGIDVSATTGQSLFAMKGGTVTYAGVQGTYGNRIVLDIGDGMTITYNHLSTIGVSVGETVSTGQVIGGAGSTGFSTGTHLHFEVTQGGSFIDPVPWLAQYGISY